MRSKKLRLDQNGVGKALGELETEVMNCIWNRSAATVRQVCDSINIHKKISFNAVMTVMNRLIEKHILEKKKEGTTFLYTPVLSKQDFAQEVATNMLSSLFNDKELLTTANFTGIANTLDPETKEKLMTFLEQSKENL